jgi:hypothetical protein
MKNQVERLNPHTADPFDVPQRRPWFDRASVQVLGAMVAVAGCYVIVVLCTGGKP